MCLLVSVEDIIQYTGKFNQPVLAHLDSLSSDVQLQCAGNQLKETYHL